MRVCCNKVGECLAVSILLPESATEQKPTPRGTPLNEENHRNKCHQKVENAKYHKISESAESQNEAVQDIPTVDDGEVDYRSFYEGPGDNRDDSTVDEEHGTKEGGVAVEQKYDSLRIGVTQNEIARLSEQRFDDKYLHSIL